MLHRGQVRADGKIFYEYRKVRNKVYERWMTPEAFSKKRTGDRACIARWQKRNKKKMLEYSKRSQKKCRPLDPARFMLVAARGRAKRAGLRFTLTKKDVVVPKRCPVLGLLLKTHTGHMKDDSPSLDRIDQRKGYVPENVVVVSYRVNRMKNSGTLKELRKLVEFYERLSLKGT